MAEKSAVVATVEGDSTCEEWWIMMDRMLIPSLLFAVKEDGRARHSSGTKIVTRENVRIGSPNRSEQSLPSHSHSHCGEIRTSRCRHFA